MSMKMKDRDKYNFREAFCLMWYACEFCKHRERIWNSRDGITPFATKCPSCGKPSLQHVLWHMDHCDPDYKLNDGQKYWRDGTPDEAAAIMTRRIAMHQDKFPISAPQAQALIDKARADSMVSDREGGSDFSKGWPMLSVHVVKLGEQ